MQPRIVVHLGASDVPTQFHEANLIWARKAVERGYEVAKTGAPAQDIVTAAVSVLEDCPVTDAGFGSVFNAKGEVQMDAGIMTSDSKYGAIVSITGVQNPIQVARLMLDDNRYSILAGEGAMEFVRDRGIPLLPPEKFVTEYNTMIQKEYGGHGDPLDLFVPPDHGTVGCVAMDVHGNIASGTSTGGTPFSPKGRVGDTPFPGCGVWADSTCGSSTTGYGEQILVELLAARAGDRVSRMPAMAAAKEAIQAFAKTPRNVGGVIIIARETREYGLFHNTKHMPFALLNDDGTITSGLCAEDLPVPK